LSTCPQNEVTDALVVIPAEAEIQKISLDTGLRRYDDWNSDTHLRGAVPNLDWWVPNRQGYTQMNNNPFDNI